MSFEKDAGVTRLIDFMTAAEWRLEGWKGGFRLGVRGQNMW